MFCLIYKTEDLIMKKNVLDNIGRKSGMSVPDGYFDSFPEKIMKRLPETEPFSEEPVTVWDRVKPWMYMAAMFAGIALMFKVFTWNSDNAGNSGNMASAEESLYELSSDEAEALFFYDNVNDYSLYEYISENY